MRLLGDGKKERERGGKEAAFLAAILLFHADPGRTDRDISLSVHPVSWLVAA